MITDSLEAPDGLGEFSTESTVFVFLVQPADFKCSQPCGPCDVRAILDTQWTASSGVRPFNPSAFLGRINKVAKPVLDDNGPFFMLLDLHAQFISLPQVEASALHDIKLLRQSNVVCGASQANIILTEFSQLFGRECLGGQLL